MKDLSGDEIGWLHIVCAIIFSSLIMSTCEEDAQAKSKERVYQALGEYDQHS
ncbi:MAG: hypothetical protein OYH77_06395 [Pseudomonadota bacterium]|nr:hypothetical protein [Pseudomonadota bacterium]